MADRPLVAELLRDPAEYLEVDPDGETYLPAELVTPRTWPLALMGTDVRIRLMVWFDANRHGAVSWADIRRAFPNDDVDDLIEQVRFLHHITAIRQVKPGLFILRNESVGAHLRDLFYELRESDAPAVARV